MAGNQTIGNLVVKLTAESGEFNKQLDAAKGKMQGFAGGVGKFLGGAGSNPLGSIIGSGGQGVSSLLGSGMLGSEAAAFAGPVGAAASMAKEAVSKLWGEMKSVGQAMLDTSKQAELYGASAAQMTALNVAAKDRAEEMAKGLLKLQRDIGAAAHGNEGLRKEFQELGLDAKALEKAGAYIAFGKVAEAIKNTTSHAEKGHIAFERFGKTGQQLMRMLNEGEGGLDKAMGRVLSKGLAPDAEMVAGFKEYKAASKELDHTLEGIKNRLASIFGGPLFRLSAAALRPITVGLDTIFGAKVDMKALKAQREAQWRDAQAKATADHAKEEQKANADMVTELQRLNAEAAVTAQRFGASAEMQKYYAAATKESAHSTAASRAELEKYRQAALKAEDTNARRQLEEENRTATERAAIARDRINDLAARGVITAELEARAKAKVADELERALGIQQQMESPKALLFGSKEAYSFEIEADRRRRVEPNNKADPKRLEDLIQRGNEIDQVNAFKLDQIERNTRDGQVKKAELF